MKILSWNVNGLRSVHQKGFLDWFYKEKADIVCLQEIKASLDKIPSDFKNLKDYFSYFNPGSRTGHSGVALFCKAKPLKIEMGIGIDRFDKEGRVIRADFKGFSLFNFYMVNGGRKKENMKYKLSSYQYILEHLRPKKTILAGDFNIAHKEIDLARPKENKNNTGFTLPERKKIDKLVSLGFVDAFRKSNKQGGNYTWWTNFAKARQRNLGWRIDYFFCSSDLSSKLKKAFIDPKVMGSDHCPAGIDMDF